MFTVGPVAENCFIARRDGLRPGRDLRSRRRGRADPAPIDELGLTVEAVLLTHTHFDHVGAVAPVARATGAPVYVSEIERPVLADIMSYVPFAGLRPVRELRGRPHAARRRAARARGVRDRRALHARPQPRAPDLLDPGRAARSFSGDVLFQGSVGRTDLPGGDWDTLLASIGGLVESLPEETTVYPGHMGITTLGAERRTNPFLAELAAGASLEAGSPRGAVAKVPAPRRGINR